MQILYWHLTRPQTSTCGGSLSPPLLQRRDGTGASARSNFPKSSIFEQALSPGTTTEPYHHQNQIFAPPLTETGDTGVHNQSQHRAMEIENDDQTPTFYLLNAVDLPEDEDSALNHHLELIHGQQNDHHENSYNGPLVAVGNGPSGGGGGGNGPPGGHYADQPRKSVANKRKKRRSNDLAGVLCIEEESDDDSAVNIGPSKSKKAKLVVNLYSEDEGYSFGYQLPGSNDCSESHVIPYSERYLLDSIDAQQIPHKMLCKMEDRQGVNLMRYRNQVIAEIRDYRKSLCQQIQNGNVTTATNGSASSALINGSASGGESEKQKPVVKQVMLRPTTESLLCDFDMLVEKAIQDRAGWSALLQQSKNDISHLLTDGSDSDFEYEVDLEASQLNQSNYLTYDQRLELEKNFINQTTGPLCLDPSPQVGVIANRVQFEQFKWNTEEMRIAAKKWEENPFKNNNILMSTPDASLNAPSFAEGRMDIEPFYAYIMSTKAKSQLGLRSNGADKDALRLPPISYQDYPNVEPPKNMDDVLRIGQPPEPAQLRLFPNENSVRKIEEYILETERRKRPHTTTLSIFQRNGMESYFGELEMESFLDPNQPRIGSVPAPSSTKCQFELGSSRNVTLYVKQFSDIFTEDGRRPCKITYQKVGQPPQVVYTNSYKPATPQTPAATTAASSSTTAPTQTTITAATVSVPQAVTSLSSSPIVVHAPITAVSGASASVVATAVTASIAVPTTQIIQTVTVPNAGTPLVPTSSITVPGKVSVSQQQQQQQPQLQRPPTPASATTIAVVGGGATTATTSAPSLPPVQIVHPQPRTTPQQQQQKTQVTTQRQGTIQIFSQQNQAQTITVPQSATPSANVNLNVNLSSSGMGGMTPQQVLTRPHIVNVSLQQQQQAAAQQQLLQLTQQRLLRMKQQQQPNTALAKLLLTNLQTKPITVAVQPTPQNPANAVAANNNSPVCSPAGASCSANNNTSSNNNNGSTSNPGSNITIASPGDQSQQNNPLGSPIMITSPPSVSSAMTNSSPNVNVNVNASPNVSVNLNTISLDGLISVSSANVNYGTAATASLNSTASNLVTASNVNLGLSRLTNSGSPQVNILRLNNSGTAVATSGASTMNFASLQRQLAVSNALNGNVSILQQAGQQPQQRILINANSMNNLNLSTVGASGEMEELSVPDLQTLLGGQPIQISQLGQHQQHILTNATGGGPSQTTIDTTNLNLNLNVNLNSGTVVNNGEAQVQQHQIAKIQGGEWTTTAQAPPFLVFISPLRPMSIATQAASGARQVTASGNNLNLSLGAVKTAQQQHHQQHHLIQNQTGKVPEATTRILLGACNNGVAIKRELPPSSVSNSMITTGSGDSNIISQNQNQQNEGSVSVDGHLLNSQQVVANSGGDVVVDGVDSLFNALSEAIDPETLHKIDAIGGSMATAASVASSITTSSHQNPSAIMVEANSTGMRVVPSSGTSVNITATSNTSSSSESAISNKQNSTNVITLSDLLGSPTVVSSSTGNVSTFPSLILSSSNGGHTITSSSSINSSPTLSSLLNSSAAPPSSGIGMTFTSSSAITTMTQSSIVSSTPRLSALLAGTPSADTVVVRTNGPTTLMSPTGTADSSSGTNTASSYGTLLDRLAASMNQPQGTTTQVRTGASRLNPIATATPSVVLDHPVLAATLTQQQNQQQPGGGSTPTSVGMNMNNNRGSSTYRQIAPAPTSSLSATGTTTSIGNSNVTVISSSDVQSHMQSPQLINLLGLVGNSTNVSGPGGTRTIRISASSPANNPSSGSASR